MQVFQNSLQTITQLRDVESRSISNENRSGAKSGAARDLPVKDENGQSIGAARELGLGWKTHPCDEIKPGETFVLADIKGSGCIQQIWMTLTGNQFRHAILRFYYEGNENPSVECPAGDFFAYAYGSFNNFSPLISATICVNPGNAFNCYWPIPFKKNVRITMENISTQKENITIFYQINYELFEIKTEIAYFHAQFRRSNPLPFGKVYTILDGVKGRGHYAGTYMAWQMNNNKWWGEGEVKMYIDGDTDPKLSEGKEIAGSTGFPTICYTGTEDYFCGSYNFENKKTQQYQEFSTPYAGVPHIVRPDGVYSANLRFSMYRWHIVDPIYFKDNLKVTIQALGWKKGGRYLPLQDDISSVAFWYQTLPFAKFPQLPNEDYLEII